MRRTTEVITREPAPAPEVAGAGEGRGLPQGERPGASARAAPVPAIAAWRFRWLNGPAAVLTGYLLLALTIRYVPGAPWQPVLAAILSLFAPGFALVSLLYPRPDALDAVERLGLSALLSLAVGGLVGFALVVSPLGLTLRHYLVAMVAFSLVCYLGDAYRRRHWVAYAGASGLRLGAAVRWYRGLRAGSRLLLALLLALTLAGVGALYGAARSVAVDPSMTEFYLLDNNGQVENLPQTAAPGAALTVSYGISDREGTAAQYHILALVGPQLVGDSGPIQMAAGATRQAPLQVVVPADASGATRIDYVLYRNGKRLRTLNLWINVAPAPTPAS